MVLIITEEVDVSTFEVIDWLIQLEKSYTIITKKSKVQILDIKISNSELYFTLCVDQQEFNFLEITSYWHRRSNIGDSYYSGNFEKHSNELLNVLSEFLKIEEKTILEMAYSSLESIKSIGGINKVEINKLTALIKAKEVGLKIPETLITRNKKVVKTHFKDNEIISKGIQSSPIVFTEKYNLQSFTESIIIEDLSDVFHPSLFQSNIQKKHEIRSFFVNNEIYSMVILSQKDEMTKTDFRQYNKKNPNRMMPYKLPDSIEDKIRKFMNLVELNTGSIDLIKTKDNEYVFLEVNPVGQYQFVSYYCNYHLNKKIALNLI